MRLKQRITEDEMILSFLNGEFDSPRWKEKITKILAIHKISSVILQNPDLHSDQENQLRKKVLAEFRGYGENKHIFSSFSSNVVWWRAVLTKDELENIEYINYDYWNELSQNTRLASVAAQTIQQGTEIFGESNDHFLEVVKKINGGVKIPELILVATDEKSRLVVLEGHVRLTAMALAKSYNPSEIEVIVGLSMDMPNWDLY